MIGRKMKRRKEMSLIKRGRSSREKEKWKYTYFNFN